MKAQSEIEIQFWKHNHNIAKVGNIGKWNFSRCVVSLALQNKKAILSRYYSATSFFLNKKEAKLQQSLIQNPPKPYTALHKQEWHVVPGQSHHGVGDLVFQSPGFEKYLVVETKYLREDPAGKSNRKKGKSKVKKQARFYRDKFQSSKPDAHVEMAIFTNLGGLQYQ